MTSLVRFPWIFADSLLWFTTRGLNIWGIARMFMNPMWVGWWFFRLWSAMAVYHNGKHRVKSVLMCSNQGIFKGRFIWTCSSLKYVYVYIWYVYRNYSSFGEGGAIMLMYQAFAMCCSEVLQWLRKQRIVASLPLHHVLRVLHNRHFFVFGSH